MARWDDREEAEDLDVGGDWFGGFEGLDDLGAWELILNKPNGGDSIQSFREGEGTKMQLNKED